MIVVLSPLPDELDRSFLGRLTRLNGLQTKAEIVEMLTLSCSVSGPILRNSCTLELLGNSTRMAMPEFVQWHSMMPLRRGITENWPKNLHGDPTNRSMLRLSGMRLARQAAYFCTVCVETDLTDIGMSYWRRDHQIPGMSACGDHLNALCYVDDINAFSYAPSEFLATRMAVAIAWADAQYCHVGIRNFIALSRILIRQPRPIPANLLTALLRERARRHGWRRNSKSFLSDLIWSRFPEDWLLNVLPEFSGKIKGEQLKMVDRVLYSEAAVSSTSFILASSLLFETAEELFTSLDIDVKNVSAGFSTKAEVFEKESSVAGVAKTASLSLA